MRLQDTSGNAINQNPPFDKIINAEVQLHHDHQVQLGEVKRRALGPDGRVFGTYDDNAMLNSMIYEVEFPDGQVKEYAANLIAESMLTQVDSEGFSTALFNGILDYKKNSSAVQKADHYVVTRRGRHRMRQMTLGWDLLVSW